MQLGMIGLGRMGANMVRRLMRDGHDCVVQDVSAGAVDGLAKEGATGSSSIEDFLKKLSTPRTICLMVPAGDRRFGHRQAGAASGSRRCDHRWGQFALPRRHRTCDAAAGQGHPLRRHGHQRRRMGPRAWVLA
jgi:hypothetical protein